MIVSSFEEYSVAPSIMCALTHPPPTLPTAELHPHPTGRGARGGAAARQHHAHRGGGGGSLRAGSAAGRHHGSECAAAGPLRCAAAGCCLPAQVCTLAATCNFMPQIKDIIMWVL